MFHFFPIAIAIRCNADEQAFIFRAEIFALGWSQRVGRISGSVIRRTACDKNGWVTLSLIHPLGVARKQKVSQSFQADLPGPALREKRNRFAHDPNQSYNSRHPGPQEGRIAIVTNVGPGCDGRESAGRAMRIAGRVFP